MRSLSLFLSLLMAVFFTACGGGGGSAGAVDTTGGTASGAIGGSTVSTKDTRLSLQLMDLSGAAIQSIPVSIGAEVVAILTTTAGLPVANQIVKVTDFSSLVFYPNGNTATTDNKGVAKIKVNRTTSTKFGKGTFTANFDGFCNPTCLSDPYFSSFNSVDFRTDPPAFKLELLDSNNTITNAIGASGVTTLKATLKFEDGTPVSQKKVEITGDLTKVKFPEGNSQLTNTSGVALIKVVRASLDVNGAGTLNAAAIISGPDSTGSVDTNVVTGILDFTVGVANIALVDLNLGSTPLAAFGNRPISVKTTINGEPAANTSVQITFNSSCGVVSPATVTTDGSGSASTTYTASLATCAGTNVFVSASAAGATPVSGTIAVASSIATNVQFVSTTPQLIYLRESVGITQAQVTFKVVDSSGNPLQNKKLRLSLSNIATGVSLNTVGNTAPVEFTTNNLGLVSAAVFSGTVPTSLNVRATLLDVNDAATSIFSNSNLLTVASGRPIQRSLSLALGKLSIEGLNRDGEETTVTLSMADRQGNPVPPGTQVNFVSESGVFLPAVCFVPPVVPATDSSPAIPTSSCTVTMRSQGTRTENGRVSILAYTVGEEDFVDNNGDNIYDGGDTFTDLGRAFRDDNGQVVGGANGVYDFGEFQVPRVLASACNASGCAGDGVWGAADVRKQATIVFASGEARIAGVFLAQVEILPATSVGVVDYPAFMVTPGVKLTINDLNNNSVPTGSTISVSVTDNTINSPMTAFGTLTGIPLAPGGCTVVGTSSFTVLNTLDSFITNIAFKTCATGDLVTVKVTTPVGTVTSRDFSVP